MADPDPQRVSLDRDRAEDVPAPGLTEHEKYLFDLHGYLVVKAALTPEQLADCRARLAERVAASPEQQRFGSGRASNAKRESDGAEEAWRAANVIEWGGAYLDLIDLPTVAPKLRSLFGDAPYRLDHDYINLHDHEKPGKLYLHGGGQGAGGPSDLVGPTDGGQCYYRYSNGRFFNGLIAVGFELETVQPGHGGFACVAGSHKANVELPRDWKSPGEEVPACVHQVAAEAGDAIIFTEAAAHGTIPWTGPPGTCRHTAFYKYTPHAVAWAPVYYNADDYPGLTESQRQLMEPPSAFGPRSSSWAVAQSERRELLGLREKVAAMEALQASKL